MKFTIEEINEKYDLELEKVLAEINNLKVTSKSKAKLVLLQFPDGLKIYATAIVNYLEEQLGEKSNTEFLIWLGSCYGACDTPVLGKDIEKQVDLVVQFGHSEMMPNY